MNLNRKFRIGDIYLIEFDGEYNEQRGCRPGIIFQNNIGNEYSPNVIVIPLTSVIKKINQPTHVLISSENTGLIKDSIALCENPMCVSKNKIGRYLTTISDTYMSEIAKASLIATSCLSYISDNELLKIKNIATILNTAIA